MFCHAEHTLLGTVGAEVEPAENVRLGAFEFILDEPVTQELLDFGDRKRECGLELVRLSGKCNAPVYAVLVKVGSGIYGVGKPFVFADFLEQARCHAGTHRDVEKRECTTVAVAHQRTVETQTPEKVRLCDVAFLYNLDTLIWCVDIFGCCSVNLFLFKFFSTKFYERFVLDFARSANVKRNFVGDLMSVLEHLLTCERLDLLYVPGDGMRDAATLEMNRVENVAHEFFGNVVIAVDFFNDDVALLFHFFLVKARVHEHVRNHVDGKRHVAAFDLRVKARFLACRVRFEISAAVFDGVRNFKRSAVLCSLENEVLVKMAEPEFIACFVAAPARDPNADGCRIGVRHVIC